MSSVDETVIRSVKDVISAFDILVSDIHDASHIEIKKKEQALETVGLMADHLIQINQVLFEEKLLDNIEKTSQEDLSDKPLVPDDTPDIDDTPMDEVSPIVTNLSETFTQALAVMNENDEIQASQTDQGGDIDHIDETLEQKSESSEGGQNAQPDKMRIVVTPYVSDEKAVLPTKTEQESKRVGTTNNLQLIKGIDSKTEALLNQYDIFKFEEIASFKEADVVRVSHLLESPFCVAHQNWIEQATLLAQDIATKYSLSLVKGLRSDQSSQSKTPAVTSDLAVSPPSAVAVQKSDREILEAELASLRKELAFQTNEGQADGNVAKSPILSLSPRLQTAIEPSLKNDSQSEEIKDEEDVDDPANLKGMSALIMDADLSAEGAMWHEEVSISADYIPPIVEEDEQVAPDFYEDSEAQSNDPFEEQNLNTDVNNPVVNDETALFGEEDNHQDDNQSEMIEGEFGGDIPDITLPQIRHHQDKFVNKAFGAEEDDFPQSHSDLSSQLSPADQLPSEENGGVLPPPIPPSPDLASLQDQTQVPALSQTMPLRHQMPRPQEGEVTRQLEAQMETQVDLERLTLAQMAHSMEQNGHKGEAVYENAAQIPLTQTSTPILAPPPLRDTRSMQPPATQQPLPPQPHHLTQPPMKQAPLNQAPLEQAHLEQASLMQDPAVQAHMPHPPVRHPQAGPGQMSVEDPGQPQFRPIPPTNQVQMTNDGQITRAPLGRPPAPPHHSGPQNGFPVDHAFHDQGQNQIQIQNQIEGQSPELQTRDHPPLLPGQPRPIDHVTEGDDQFQQKKKPQVSAGFKLKARKFAQTLQRSFVNKED